MYLHNLIDIEYQNYDTYIVLYYNIQTFKNMKVVFDIWIIREF